MNCKLNKIWSKMKGGELYDATHPELVKLLEATTILPGVKIGNNIVIGAGSVVTKISLTKW